MNLGWILFLGAAGVLLLVCAALMLVTGYKAESKPRTVVHVYNRSPRPRRESAYKRVKRQQAAERKAYHESEWRSYGSFGPW